MNTDRIGLVGLGLLGSAIAQRLLGADYRVLGYDVVPDKRAAFAYPGAAAADSLADVAAACRVVIVAVFDTGQVETVVEGPGGLLGSAARVAICMSTCDPDRIGALASRAAKRGLGLLDYPVSGTSAQVARGEGLGLAAGDPGVIDAVGPVLSAICPRRHTLGPAGNGSRAKLAINLILGLNRAAIAEGLAFGERLGLERARLLAVARDSAAYSQVMDVKGALWAENRFAPPQSRVDQSLKDFELMLAMGERIGLALPLARLYRSLLADCVAHGEAAFDNAAIINAIRRQLAPPRAAGRER